VESIEWTVHLANKKAVWYNNDEFIGNVYLAGDPNAQPNGNYYPDPNVPPTPLIDASLRNWYIQGEERRQKELIIDPGPRTVNRSNPRAEFSRKTIPKDYPKGAFPPIDPDNPRVPYEIDTLGNLIMARSGRLVVLGGYGRAGGQVPIATYTGADTWFDDTSDGPVWCRLKLKGQDEPIVLTAWALIGSPKYAPELRNISTLDDIMFDVGVRYQNLVPDLYSEIRFGGYNNTYMANFDRDVEPILERRCASCHGAASPAAGLPLTRAAAPVERDGVSWPGAYFRLVLDTAAELSPAPPDGEGQWYLPQLTRYLRAFQSRQSLLLWKVWGARLDGRTNEDRSDDLDFVPSAAHPAGVGLLGPSGMTYDGRLAAVAAKGSGSLLWAWQPPQS
jgi:L-lysine 6-oxidase